jgi:hypothetical protein
MTQPVEPIARLTQDIEEALAVIVRIPKKDRPALVPARGYVV